MVAPTLVAGALLTFGAGLAYLAVGVVFARQARGRGLPLALFSLFWLAIGFYGVTDGLWSLAVPTLGPDLSVGVTILVLKTLVGCAGFFGLVYYLLFVYTGDRRLLVPLAAFYGLVYVVVLYSYLDAQPVGQVAQTWRSGLVYANGGTFLDLLGTLALFVPPLVATVAYARLVPKTHDPAQRRRVLTVSASLVVFFGGLLVGWVGISAWFWWPLVEKGLGVATGVAVVWALRGPRPAQG